MVDPPSDAEPHRIVPSRRQSLAYWAQRLGVTVEQVEDAVAAVGDDPGAVAAHLGKPWPDAFDGIV